LDSLTHIAVGSAIGMAVMGRRLPRWKSAMWGAVCQTLPDLDTFIPHGDPIRSMTFHRTESHSLFYLALASPLVAWAISRLQRSAAPVPFGRWWLLVFLGLVLHPLLDLFTIYGTQLLLPFTDYPFGIGSIFIIDPMFSLPVMIGAIVALSWRSERALRWNAAGMVFGALYLGWTLLAQQYATSVVRASLQAQHIDAPGVEVDPTAFNTVLWRVTVMTPQSYLEGYYSLLDDSRDIRFHEHPRGAELYERLKGDWNVARMAWFTHGFFKMEQRGDGVFITDLRLGMEPSYGFTFWVFEERNGQFVPVKPQQTGARLSGQPVLQWLWRRLLGEPLAPVQ
jgi:inner membrane protein